jgi:hypothetical protein
MAESIEKVEQRIDEPRVTLCCCALSASIRVHVHRSPFAEKLSIAAPEDPGRVPA